jgi:rRNA maturation endonuclease Nob1
LPARLDPDPDATPRRLNIVAPESWVQRVDDWRRKQADLPNLSEAIRRLVEAGLDAERKGRRR